MVSARRKSEDSFKVLGNHPFLWLSKPATISIHIFLDFIAVFSLFDGSVQVLDQRLKPKLIKFLLN